MNFIAERVSYLKGLAEGLQIQESTNEGKLILAIIEVLHDISKELSDIEEVQYQLNDEIECIDSDLADLEKVMINDECDECNDEEYYEDDDDFYLTDIECPHCSERITINKDMVDLQNDSIICPVCNKEISIEWETDEEDISENTEH